MPAVTRSTTRSSTAAAQQPQAQSSQGASHANTLSSNPSTSSASSMPNRTSSRVEPQEDPGQNNSHNSRNSSASPSPSPSTGSEQSEPSNTGEAKVPVLAVSEAPEKEENTQAAATTAPSNPQSQTLAPISTSHLYASANTPPILTPTMPPSPTESVLFEKVEKERYEKANWWRKWGRE